MRNEYLSCDDHSISIRGVLFECVCVGVCVCVCVCARGVFSTAYTRTRLPSYGVKLSYHSD